MRYFIGLLFFLSTMVAQVTDKNFKDEIGDGFSVVVFTSEWQEQDLNQEIRIKFQDFTGKRND